MERRKTMKKTFLIILALISLGAAFYMGTQTYTEVKLVETIINLTESEKKQVEQEARLHWIPLDSAWALAKILTRWEVKDSIDWTFKDSLVVRDSVAITYIPYFEAEDTIITFDETDSLKQIRVQLSLAVKPRYFPTYRKFLTDVQMLKLSITQPEQVDSWWKHRWVVYFGYGIGYSFQAGQRDQYTNGYTTYSHDHEGWYHGFQFGIGFRVY